LAYALPEAVPEESVAEAYYVAQRALLDCVGNGEISGNYLQNHLCLVIAREENVFARMAENGVFKKLKPGMSDTDIRKTLDLEAYTVLSLAASEIQLISPIYHFDFAGADGVYDGHNIAAARVSGGRTSHREMIHQAMSSNSIDGAILLANHYHSYGSGIFEAAPALNAEEKGLVPVAHTDPILMTDLVGYKNQKRMLIDNAKILLSGLMANNVLLYGDSGTGKSSSVKALLNLYSSKGLKMICVTKDKLGLLPVVLEMIEGRGMKFIIFIDDLSFEENEHEYKLFKSIMEGRATPRPKNTIFVVTTNRKNIVKDVWSDREGRDDVRRRDNMQEKRSLSDRFGITLIYSEPDKQEYLAIVRSLADKSGLSIPADELDSEALKWEIRHGGRSGRTAQQFVNYMVGIQMMNKGERDL
jgi:predicted AAA+ superfamily ATPase